MTPVCALVTGAGSGIGAAVTVAAAREGTLVAAVDVDGAPVRELARRHGAEVNGRILPLEADVRDEAQLRAAIACCTEQLGVTTAVLANAGIETNAPAHELALDQWDGIVGVNLTGVFLTVRNAIRGMLAAGVGGSIVCTSSPAAFVGWSGGGNAAYAASKGGVSAMVRSLALDYAPQGIRVNAVVPGITRTPLVTAGVTADRHEEVLARVTADAREQVPLGRMAEPQEIAAAVMWLWSDAASYVTGSHLVVDGGLMAKSANTI